TPASGSSRPATTRRSVVLPAPFGPTRPTRSPSATEASTRSRITNAPISRTSPESRTIDMSGHLRGARGGSTRGGRTPDSLGPGAAFGRIPFGGRQTNDVLAADLGPAWPASDVPGGQTLLRAQDLRRRRPIRCG